MKKLTVILVMSLYAFAGCDDAEEQTEPPLRNKLLKTWTLSEGAFVKAGGVAVTEKYTDLSFKFEADGTYVSSVNGEETSGTWRETDSSISTLILDETVTVNVFELTDKTLLISFTNKGMISARTKSISTFEILLLAE